ncbi:MAG: hypothetical protein KTV77_00890 [Wolbachia endosymbiont of Fragariocoptes setiger]|nr:hypothetical protein [Wolbachia endosymbiont of Fragariocoptes setiger]
MNMYISKNTNKIAIDINIKIKCYSALEAQDKLNYSRLVLENAYQKLVLNLHKKINKVKNFTIEKAIEAEKKALLIYSFTKKVAAFVINFQRITKNYIQ